MLLGIPVVLIDVIGDRIRGLNGFVERDHQIVDVPSARRHMIMVLAGPIMADCPEDPVPHWWPLHDNRPDSDEAHLKLLAEACGFTETDWHGLLAEAYRFTCTPEFVHLFTGITGLLDHRPQVDTAALSQLIAAIGEP